MLVKDIHPSIIAASSVLQSISDDSHDFNVLGQETHDLFLEYLTSNYSLSEQMWTINFLENLGLLKISYHKQNHVV
jgi:endonuclease III-like uncharacterized protein